MTSTADQIYELGVRWVAAELDADIATLDALVTDDFHLVGPYGFVLAKQQWLDRYRSGDFVTTAMTWHDIGGFRFVTGRHRRANASREAAS
jgi:Domain of unknown function (DUF4440)